MIGVIIVSSKKVDIDNKGNKVCFSLWLGVINVILIGSYMVIDIWS